MIDRCMIDCHHMIDHHCYCCSMTDTDSCCCLNRRHHLHCYHLDIHRSNCSLVLLCFQVLLFVCILLLCILLCCCDIRLCMFQVSRFPQKGVTSFPFPIKFSSSSWLVPPIFHFNSIPCLYLIRPFIVVCIVAVVVVFVVIYSILFLNNKKDISTLQWYRSIRHNPCPVIPIVPLLLYLYSIIPLSVCYLLLLVLQYHHRFNQPNDSTRYTIQSNESDPLDNKLIQFVAFECAEQLVAAAGQCTTSLYTDITAPCPIVVLLLFFFFYFFFVFPFPFPSIPDSRILVLTILLFSFYYYHHRLRHRHRICTVYLLLYACMVIFIC